MEKHELDFLIRFVSESDAIEKVRNDPDVLARQFDEEHNPERIGHAGALLRLRDQAMLVRTPLTEALVKEVQSLVTADQHLRGANRELHPAERGAWRQGDIWIAGGPDSSMRQIGSNWQNVPADMAAWLALAASATSVRDIAFLHWRYERIHPFADGNGRSGRALVYYFYRRAHLKPFIFTSKDKKEAYYPCFQCATSELMERYFLSRTR